MDHCVTDGPALCPFSFTAPAILSNVIAVRFLSGDH
jgi:hypothetical protein